MKSVTQESIELSATTALSAVDRIRSKAGLALFGMNRIGGHLRLQISQREGKTLPEAHVKGVAIGGSDEGGFLKYFFDLWEMVTRLEQW